MTIGSTHEQEVHGTVNYYERIPSVMHSFIYIYTNKDKHRNAFYMVHIYLQYRANISSLNSIMTMTNTRLWTTYYEP